MIPALAMLVLGLNGGSQAPDPRVLTHLHRVVVMALAQNDGGEFKGDKEIRDAAATPLRGSGLSYGLEPADGDIQVDLRPNPDAYLVVFARFAISADRTQAAISIEARLQNWAQIPFNDRQAILSIWDKTEMAICKTSEVRKVATTITVRLLQGFTKDWKTANPAPPIR
ncbi:MAG: hypothetical protein ACHQ50_01045 [Fimbriimonadales bacterium]